MGKQAKPPSEAISRSGALIRSPCRTSTPPNQALCARAHRSGPCVRVGRAGSWRLRPRPGGASAAPRRAAAPARTLADASLDAAARAVPAHAVAAASRCAGLHSRVNQYPNFADPSVGRTGGRPAALFAWRDAAVPRAPGRSPGIEPHSGMAPVGPGQEGWWHRVATPGPCALPVAPMRHRHAAASCRAGPKRRKCWPRGPGEPGSWTSIPRTAPFNYSRVLLNLHSLQSLMTYLPCRNEQGKYGGLVLLLSHRRITSRARGR